jgi:DNA-binding NarL/FixJ family response regulator
LLNDLTSSVVVAVASQGSPMKALLVDDHPLILSGLRTVIEGFGDGVIVACVETARAARELLAADPRFDLVLLDLQLGDCSGFDLLVELRATYPDISVVVLSSSDSNDDVTRAIYLGAMGFVPKRASNQVLFGALNMVMSGGIYVPPMALRSQVGVSPVLHHDRAYSGHRPVGTLGVDAPLTRSSAAALGLTPRQTDVLELLLQGQSNKLIARALNLSVETIKDHVAAVLRTLNVSSRTQAVLAVSQRSTPATPPLPWREVPRSDARSGP